MPNKFTEGLKQLPDGRYRLKEKVIIDEQSIVRKLPLTEKLTEAYNGQDLPIFGTYLVRIWIEQGLNKNRRNYSHVFPYLIEKKPITCGLMGHPDDDGSPKDIFAVFKNPQMHEGWLCVEMTLVGRPWGENTEAELRAGLAIELSSSAIGDVDSQGYVILKGFELERWGDKVFGPSNGLSQTLEDIKIQKPSPSKVENTENLSKNIVEQIEKDNVEENLTILEPNRRNIMDETKALKLQETIEKSLSRSVKAMLSDARKEQDLTEKKLLLESVIDSATDLTDTSLLDEAKTLLESTDKGILELAEKGKTVDTLQETIKTTTELSDSKVKEVGVLQESVKSIQEKYDTLVKLYEEKQYQASETEQKVNRALNEQLIAMRQRYRKVMKERVYFEALSNTRIEAEDYIVLQEAYSELEDSHGRLYESEVSARKELRGLKLKLAEGRKNTFRSRVEVEPRVLPKRRVREVQEKVEVGFIDPEIQRFYEGAIIDNPLLEKFEDQFMACRSLREAQEFKMSKTERTEEYTPRSQTRTQPKDKRIQEVAPEQDYGDDNFDKLLEAAHLDPSKSI